MERLDIFIEKYNLLINHQHGFRANRSTSMAENVEKSAAPIDNQEHTVGVVIVSKKDFDTIDHNVLLRKMERYGVRGVVHSWPKSEGQDAARSFKWCRLRNIKG